MPTSATAILAGISILLLSWFAFCLITYKPPEEQRELCDTNYQYYSEQDGKCVDIPDFREEEIARRGKEMQDFEAEQQMERQEQNYCNIKGNINFSTGEKSIIFQSKNTTIPHKSMKQPASDGSAQRRKLLLPDGGNQRYES